MPPHYLYLGYVTEIGFERGRDEMRGAAAAAAAAAATAAAAAAAAAAPFRYVCVQFEVARAVVLFVCLFVWKRERRGRGGGLMVFFSLRQKLVNY